MKEIPAPSSDPKKTGNHNDSTWIMFTQTTGQDGPNAALSAKNQPKLWIRRILESQLLHFA